MPFLLLPFRPGTDPVGSKSFIRNFFKMQYEGTWQDTGLEVRKELMLMEPIVSVPWHLPLADSAYELYRYCAA
jgi:hypothetical protein